MKRISSLVLFLLAFGGHVVNLSGQTATCVTTDLQMMEQRLRANQAANWERATVRDVQYVPLQFHLVGNTDGSQRIPEIQVLDMLCILNEKFEDQEIQFYILDGSFNYINDTNLNNQPNSNTSTLKGHRIANAVNIFITNATGVAGGAGYYQSPAGWGGNDFIVVDRSFAYLQNVLPHEIGHFFSLLHPFHGWENNPWDLNTWGSPVGTFAPSDPALFPTDILNERQDGSNCTTAGDLICDTPPDYLFAQHPSQAGCSNWPIAVKDPANVVVNPMETNIMSYFANCSDYVFTPNQKAAIINDLLFSTDRAYVRSNYTPDLTVIQEVPNLLFPANNSTIPSTEQVILSWIPVLTADYYAVEIDVSPTFSTNLAKSKTVSASIPSAIFENLAGNQTYYWRVRPFTEYYTCTGLSDQWEFTTPASTSNTDLEGIDDWSIVPNMVAEGAPLFLKINASRTFQAAIQIYDFQGRLVYTSGKRQFAAGEGRYELSVQLPTAGMYIFHLENEKGSSSQKFVRL